jgi:hypothetical protein
MDHRNFLEKLTVVQFVKKYSAFYRTRNFIALFTSAHTRPYPEPEESIPRSKMLFMVHFDIILPSTIRFPQ